MRSRVGEIEVVEINDHLSFFYWGRHAQHAMLDMQLGGGCYAIYRDRAAIVVDTMTKPGQGLWVKEYLQQKHAISSFRVVNSHWHVDHVIDNCQYPNDVIIAHSHTRRMLLEQRQLFEAGQFGDYPPFTVLPPNLTFSGRLDLWLGDLKVELHEFLIHEKGHLGVLLPAEKIFLASDLLEDPLWFFDFTCAPPQQQLAELERMLSLDVERILPSHGSLETIRAGGYDKSLIRHNAAYLRTMLKDRAAADFADKSAQDYLGEALQAGELNWWQAYAKVHELNKETLKKYTAG